MADGMRKVLGRDAVHPFPARMSPGLVLDVVAGHDAPMRVCDPMAGSGTVLAITQAGGHRAVGVDADPLSVLMSRVWTTPIDKSLLKDEAAGVLGRARMMSELLSMHDAWPAGSDGETRRFARYWFDGRSRRQLASLAREISEVWDAVVRNALWCAFSNLIIAKQSGASLAMDLAHSRPHRAFVRAPAEPFPNFMRAVARVADGCIGREMRGAVPDVDVREGDARRLRMGNGSVDMVVTSPPYLNAIDYMRCSKFSLVWMGYHISDLRRIRSESIGTEAGGRADDAGTRRIASMSVSGPELGPRQHAMLARYVGDMRGVVRETARVLGGGGRAVFVVGENVVRGSLVRNSVILRELAAGAGLRHMSSRARDLPTNRRYLPPPSGRSTALGRRMRREVILTLEKV